MSSQQATIGPALMEEVERTNTVMMRGLGQGRRTPPRKDSYAMDIDRGKSCYICGVWAHGPLLQKPKRKGSSREEVGI